jgi:hypothetical protein
MASAAEEHNTSGRRKAARRSDATSEAVRVGVIVVRGDEVLSDLAGGEATVCEPEACERWRWFALDDAPEPLFPPVTRLRAKRFRL